MMLYRGECLVVAGARTSAVCRHGMQDWQFAQGVQPAGMRSQEYDANSALFFIGSLVT